MAKHNSIDATEAAVAKLMYLLGSGLNADAIKQYLGKDMVGELTAN